MAFMPGSGVEALVQLLFVSGRTQIDGKQQVLQFSIGQNRWQTGQSD